MTIYDNPRSRSFTDLCPRSLTFNIFKFLFLKKNTRLLKPNFIWSEPPWDVRNENLFKYSRSYDQNGFQVHIWKKNFKNLLLRNQEADDLETWNTALGSLFVCHLEYITHTSKSYSLIERSRRAPALSDTYICDQDEKEERRIK